MKTNTLKNIRSKATINNALFAMCLLLALSLVWNTVKVIQKNYALQADVQRLDSEIAVLELQNQNLTYDIEYFKTDEFLELAARRKLNKAGPGESVVFLPKQPAESSVAAINNVTEQPISNFDQWVSFLMGDR